MNTSFEWDEDKNEENLRKHGIDFETAQYAFTDSKLIMAEDVDHSKKEKRYYCFRKVIRIIGAGFWRKSKKIYKEKNRICR